MRKAELLGMGYITTMSTVSWDHELRFPTIGESYKKLKKVFSRPNEDARFIMGQDLNPRHLHALTDSLVVDLRCSF
jgi:hypothetical protein